MLLGSSCPYPWLILEESWWWWCFIILYACVILKVLHMGSIGSWCHASIVFSDVQDIRYYLVRNPDIRYYPVRIQVSSWIQYLVQNRIRFVPFWTLVNSLVVSKIDYCNCLLVGMSLMPAHLTEKPQYVMNAAARIVCGLKNVTKSQATCETPYTDCMFCH